MANRKKSPTTQKRKAILITFGVVVFIGYLSIVLFGSHGFLTLSDKKNEKQQLIQTIHTDSIKNKTLKDQLDKIKNDPEYIEKVAREKYNMQKPGEKVYQIEKTDSTDKE